MQSRFIASGIMLGLATALPCFTAWADWSFQVVGSGSTTRQTPLYPGTTADPWITTDDENWVVTVGLPFPDGDYIGQTLKATSQGTLTLEAYWSGQTVPESVTVQVTTSAYGYHSASANGTSTYTESNSGYQGRRLFTLSGQNAVLQANGQYKITKDLGSFNAQSTATIGTTPGSPQDADDPDSPDTSDYNMSVHARVNGSAIEDNRTVSLSRSGRYERGPLLENGESHTYGDSIYSASTPSGQSNNQVSINANYQGNNWATTFGNASWNITPSWVSGGALSSTLTQSNTNLFGYAINGTPTIGADGKYMGSPTGAQTFDISYTATDNADSATAKAYYHLTLHDPVEPVSSGEGEAVSLSVYTVKSPAKDSEGPFTYYGGPNGRPAGQRETKIRIAHSDESGMGLTATVSINLFKDMLGFEGEGYARSSDIVEVDTEKPVPAIPVNRFVYLIAVQPFQRRHTRFYVYDAGGKIKRFATQDSSGQTYPPFETYHEAIRDLPRSHS